MKEKIEPKIVVLPYNSKNAGESEETYNPRWSIAPHYNSMFCQLEEIEPENEGEFNVR